MSVTFTNDDLNGDDFKKLFEESLKTRDDYSVGDEITGTIVHINNENAFLNISGKSEAIIDIKELKDKDDKLIFSRGDRITAFIVSMKRGEIKVTKNIGSGEIDSSLLLTAYKKDIPIEGTVTAEVKGGYSINVSGFRCFCPYSQIDIKASDEKSRYINKSFSFKIIEYRENGKNIILSRRVLLEENQKKQENFLKENLKPGDIISGKVATIQPFGIFVDLNGVQGLVPKSELSWSRAENTTGISIGDDIKVKVLETDWNSGRISLSIKQLTDEPWSQIGSFSENQVINGKVVNIIPQGAFIEIIPGIEGFMHVSKMSYTKRIMKPEEILKKGDTISARILTIDRNSRKISLQLITDEADPWQTPVDRLMSEIQIGIVENVSSNGVNLRLGNGMLGFIPKKDLFHGNDIQKNYTAGKELKVAIKEIQAESRKLILSEKEAGKKEEERDYKAYMIKENIMSSSSLGSLFNSKFDDIKNKLKAND